MSLGCELSHWDPAAFPDVSTITPLTENVKSFEVIFFGVVSILGSVLVSNVTI